jgi:hypothetical protein
MPLPHFTQIYVNDSPGGPGSNPEEVIYLNLFEITFFFPVILQAQGRDPFHTLQQASSVDLDLTPGIEVITQQFKYSTRAFMKTPAKTHVEFKIKFNVNQNQNGNMEIWDQLKAWYDIVWNSQNGTLHYKSDIIGTIIVNQHDKKGVVIRRVTFQNVQIKGVATYTLDWTATEIFSTDADFVADYWIDEYIDGNFSIAPPLITGY